ncbi:MAG: HAD family hydrolase [Campylobacter sp.]|nr:HAD family hydrolase [Campylobacter sp.]
MKSVIFDMDGTLIDSSVAIEKTTNEIREILGLAPLDKNYIIKTINDPEINWLIDLYEGKITLQNKGEFEKKFKQNYDKFAKTYDGVIEMLKKCKQAGFALVLASNAPKITLEAILKKCEIYDFFDFIIGSSESIPKKPDPSMLLCSAEKTSAKKAIFIGDSLKDELAAKNAKMPYIQVSWGFGTISQTAKYNATNCNEIWAMVEEIFNSNE